MKSGFKIFLRGFVLVFVSIFFWGIGAGAQETKKTNSTDIATVKQPDEPTEQLIKIPEVMERHEELLTFGLDRVKILQKNSLGYQPRWKYLASLIYIALAFCVSRFLDYLMSVWLRKLAQKTATLLDDLLLDLLKGPITIFSFVILLHVGLSIFYWPDELQQFVSKGLNLIVVCAFARVLFKAIDVSISYWKLSASAAEDRAFDEQLFIVVRKSLKIFILIIALLFIAENIFNQNITAILTSLSIGGLALGLAAQDTLANFFGAVAMFMDKPFHVGDAIKLADIEGAEGSVEAIGLRSTQVRNLDGHLISIPNKTMGNATIMNITRRPNIRSQTNIGLTHDTSSEKLKRALVLLDEIYKSHPMTHDVLIAFNKFTDSTLNIQVVHWWKSTNVKEQLMGIQEMNLHVKKRFDDEGIHFAFPSQTVYLKQNSDWRIASASGS